ncbi:C-type mannose receptor 2 [Plakobranchus ocellatus]|uniref:C-type mannose receptor 2 n=1 Tax=Plakobranchus ocellatus TaxID=259542 RepID=A0AAV4AXD2_9GAST|nr:C-type mannose receptor 2 [Plakobranchus ocellatus]
MPENYVDFRLRRNEMVQLISIWLVIAFVTVTAAQTDCPDGFRFSEGSCYHIGGAGFTLYEARKECEKKDSDLVEISSPEENAFIKSLLKDDDATGAWIGFVLRDDKDGQWLSTYTRNPISFTDWVDDEAETPPGLTGTGDFWDDFHCAFLSNQHDWAWESQDCFVRDGMKFVCKSCPLQQVCTSRACFRLLCDPERENKAKAKCENLGGSLATIRSEEESKAVKTFLNKASIPQVFNQGPGEIGVRLAGSDEGTEGDWYWYARGETLKISDGFTDWSDNAPNNTQSLRGGDENCMVMESRNDWKWNDVPCGPYSYRPSLCEIPVANAMSG